MSYSTQADGVAYLVGDSVVDISGAPEIPKQYILANASTTPLYVRLGAAPVSLTAYTYRLNSRAILELSGFAGKVTAVRNTGNTGFVYVTEVR